MNITRERITRISLGQFLSYATGWSMRLWRQEDLATPAQLPGRLQLDSDVHDVIGRLALAACSPLELAKHILELPRMNAVEIIDMQGFGEKLRKQ